MAEKHVVYCRRCGELFDLGTMHKCPVTPRLDTPFATVVERNLPMLDVVTGRIVSKFQAEVIDMENKAIVDAVIRAAQEDGITALYLLDRQFILEAIREKLERER